jgi:uncharacterized spore protein YtfJ
VNVSSDEVVDRIGERVVRGVAPLVDMSASRIFGAPVACGDRTVIPAAAFDLAAGFGFGGGGDETNGSGGGGGGGGHSHGRPVAIIEITNDGVRVKPVLDWTRIGVTAIGTGLPFGALLADVDALSWCRRRGQQGVRPGCGDDDNGMRTSYTDARGKVSSGEGRGFAMLPLARGRCDAMIEWGREVPIFALGSAVRRVGVLAAVAGLMVGLASCGGDDNSASSQLDRSDTSDGIKVTVTSCEAEALEPLDDGFDTPQTLYTAKGTVENTTDEPRVGVKVRVTYLDGDDAFYATDDDETFSFGGFGEEVEGVKEFSQSATLSDEAEDLRCEATATTS